MASLPSFRLCWSWGLSWIHSWNNLHPAFWTLFYVRIVGLRFRAVIPVILFFRLLRLLLIYRRLLFDYNWLPRVVIQWIDKRTPPQRSPSWSDPDSSPYRRRPGPERVYWRNARKKHNNKRYHDSKGQIYRLFHNMHSFPQKFVDKIAPPAKLKGAVFNLLLSQIYLFIL
jgi:hypothetical protein